MRTKLLKYISFSAMTLALTCSSCTSRFEEMNTNNEGVYGKDLIPDDNLVAAYMPALQQSIYFNYDWGEGADYTFQLYQNLNADLFSGMMSTINFGSSNATYAMKDSWTGYAWITAYGYTMSNVNNVYKLIDKYPQYDMSVYRAWTDILKVGAMHRLVEAYGPIIYSQFGKSDLGAAYDDEKSVFNQFFSELDDAVKKLTEYEAEFPNNKRFKKSDLVYQGKMTSWIKYANTLRLRLAMNIIKIDAAKAKEQAEKAVLAGVIDDVSDNANVAMRHPLAALAEWGGDITMSADMESMLKGYEDPRLAEFFRQGSDKVLTDFTGMRSGLGILKDKTNPYLEKFYVPNYVANDKVVIATAAEVYFLRAEGALRGWDMGGTPEDLYTLGIRASFSQYGFSKKVDDYLDSDKMPADYVDSNAGKLNIAAVNLVSPKWDESVSKEVKLQKIMTQKWLALYPDGAIAWTDIRRTGYPKLFPVVKNESVGVVDTNLGPRRLPYPGSESTGNTANYNDGVSKLGGADNAGTRLWWDVDAPNF